MIDPRELEYTDKDYRGGSLELPDPIVPLLLGVSAEGTEDEVRGGEWVRGREQMVEDKMRE